MTAKRVVIAAGHLGLPLKDEVKEYLEGQGVEVVDIWLKNEFQAGRPGAKVAKIDALDHGYRGAAPASTGS